MLYSQKYCLVHFIEPLAIGTAFDMHDWPLHITLADVFAIDRNAVRIDDQLKLSVGAHAPVKAHMTEYSTLGETPVVLIKKTPELTRLHMDCRVTPEEWRHI